MEQISFHRTQHTHSNQIKHNVSYTTHRLVKGKFMLVQVSSRDVRDTASEDKRV